MNNPAVREGARVRQRIGRYDRAVRAASDRGDWAAMERYVTLLDRDIALLDTTHAPPTGSTALVAPDTTADAYTPAATVDWSDDDLLIAWAELGDDPAAQDQIMATLEWRSDIAADRDAEIAAHEEHQRAERDRAWAAAREDADASPLTNPARRPARRLSAEQSCREEYDCFLHVNYVAAEDECRGVLLNRDGVAAMIDPASLFTGPAARVKKYASEELRTWFGHHGRITYSEWKYDWFGRQSDRAAARTARYQTIGETTL